MNSLTIDTNYQDPEKFRIEAVERKGVGHPDSLADALSNEVSIAFSKHCLSRFGIVLHHNVDKLFIGGGNTINSFGKVDVHRPISVLTNGRMSDMFGDQKIDIQTIQEEAIKNYLFKVMPRLQPEHVVIHANATQWHRVTTQYRPRGREDIHYLRTGVKANDTSYCVSHWPPSLTESLTYRLERYFWKNIDGYAVPRFAEIGQDIKVFCLRNVSHIEVTVSAPTISTLTASKQAYEEIINLHCEQLRKLAQQIVEPSGCTVSLHLNRHGPYMLGLGSCIECGEEGLVGRGNNILGIISNHRTHTQESWAGKNPVYHTGRVLGYLTLRLARAISEELRVRCSVETLTECAGSLIPPAFMRISTGGHVDEAVINSLVESHFLSVKYVDEILAFRPWMLEL